MRSERTVLAAMATLLLAGCASADRPAQAGAGAAVSNVADFKATGPTVQCIPLRGTQLTPADDRHVMARISANRQFRNELRAPCPGMRRDRTIILRANTGQMCDMDIFEVVDPISRMSFGVCSLGSFTPVEVPKGARW